MYSITYILIYSVYLLFWSISPISCLLSTIPRRTSYLTDFGWFPTRSCCCFTPYTNILLTGLLKPLLGLNCCFSPGGISFLPSPNFSSRWGWPPIAPSKIAPRFRDSVQANLPSDAFLTPLSLWLSPLCHPLLECLVEFLPCSYSNSRCLGTPGPSPMYISFSSCFTISYCLVESPHSKIT